MNIHVISGTEYFITIFTLVGQLSSKMDVFNMFHCTTFVTVYLMTKCAPVGLATDLWTLFNVTIQHHCYVFHV